VPDVKFFARFPALNIGLGVKPVSDLSESGIRIIRPSAQLYMFEKSLHGRNRAKDFSKEM